ncbi:hypothetical protein P3G55_03545 [Leptospira sp. 96542]|nr:hypothetical protein [Leptospira sp. 96542]
MPDNRNRMLFAAFAMILVGVLCFLYVSLSPQNPKTSHTKQKRQPNTNFRYGAPSSVSPQLDERIRKERGIFDSPSLASQNIAEEVAPSVVEKASILKPDDQTGILKEESLPPEVKFQIEGNLYLDYSGKLEFGGGGDLESMEENLRNFKRIGSGVLKEETGKFIFNSGNVTYTYEVRELEEVVLHNQGIVFLPKDSKAPRPVFFTKDMDQFKEFLEQASSSKV